VTNNVIRADEPRVGVNSPEEFTPTFSAPEAAETVEDVPAEDRRAQHEQGQLPPLERPAAVAGLVNDDLWTNFGH
jgi:hypothetical protein